MSEYCSKCLKEITIDNYGDNYDFVHFICKICFSDETIKNQWEFDKIYYAIIDFELLELR